MILNCLLSLLQLISCRGIKASEKTHFILPLLHSEFAKIETNSCSNAKKK